MHELHHVGGGLELILQNHNVLVLEADDRVDLRAAVVELLEHGIGDGAADAAADHADLLLALGLGRTAERADEVLNELALLLVTELLGGRADGLHNDGNGALLAVVVMDRDGDAFAVFIDAQDDELAGLGLLCHHRRLDLIQDDGRLERFFSDDAIHSVTSFLQISVMDMK